MIDMKKTISIFLLPLLLSSCEKDDDSCGCAGVQPGRFDTMQHIRLSEVDENGHFWAQWGIKDIHKKDVELIAMAKYFAKPLLGKDGNVVKQVPGVVEAVPVFNDLNYMELYMKNQKLPDDRYIPPPFPNDSYFVLKIDDGLWFNIKTTYYEGRCGIVYLKSFEFDGEEYAASDQRRIPIDEAKKRAELKEMYPNGFPYRL